ncbi:MAG: glutaredoxin family protein [Rhodanobacteraceae bacterium]|nr:glutaredoxin family protein [Rhodanobacteraceae bacterium]
MSTGRILIVIAALFGGLHLYATRDGSANDPRKGTGANGIVMLSASWCGYCDALRQDLDRMGVAYSELDIDDEAQGSAAFDAVNARGVPVLVIGQDIVYGYDPDRARELIAAAGYRVIAH